MSKPRSLTPLETIYEESGSFNISTSSSQHAYTDETINGLISARSIPSVNIQQQRALENQSKPPIEVRFRDGSIQYIHPSSTKTMIVNRRNLLDSSHNNLSSKKISNLNSQKLIQSNFNKKNFQTKPPLVFTIITVEDLKQAGVKSSIYSSSDESDLSSQTMTPTENTKTIEDIHKVYSKPLLPVKPTSPLQNSLQQQQQVIINYGQNLIVPSPASMGSFTTSAQLTSSVSTPKSSNSLHRVTLTNDENERNLSLNSNLNNKAVNQIIQPITTTLFPSKFRSAFRPFLKTVPFNQETNSLKPRVLPIVDNRKSFIPKQQQQPSQVVPSTSTMHTSFQPPTRRNNVVGPKYSMIPTRIKLDVRKTSSSTNNPLINMNSSIYQQPSKSTNNSLALPHVSNVSSNSGQTFSFIVNSNTPWFNVSSNSIYDIPHLSSKYSRIPLRITLPVATPTHNQNFIYKHNPGLEQRLLNAGLSPETIALYQKILEVAGTRPRNILSPPQTINQNQYKPFNKILL